MTQPSPPDTGYFRTGISCAAMAFLGFVNWLPQPTRHPKTGAKFRTTPDAPTVQQIRTVLVLNYWFPATCSVYEV